MHPQNFLSMPIIGVIMVESRDPDEVLPEDRFGLLEHASILALNCIFYN